MNYSKGISWFDDCRIPFVGDSDLQKRLNEENSRKSDKIREGFSKTIAIPKLEQEGRFPPNLLCSDDMLNDGSVSNGKVGMTQQASNNEIFGKFNSKGDTKINDGISDKGSNSRYYDIDLWFNNLLNNYIY